MRPTLVPLSTTLVGQLLALFLGSSLLVEVVFGIPGIGRVTYNALIAQDTNLLLGSTLAFTFIAVIGNLFGPRCSRCSIRGSASTTDNSRTQTWQHRNRNDSIRSTGTTSHGRGGSTCRSTASACSPLRFRSCWSRCLTGRSSTNGRRRSSPSVWNGTLGPSITCSSSRCCCSRSTSSCRCSRTRGGRSTTGGSSGATGRRS